GRGGDLDAVVGRAAGRGLLPLQGDGGRRPFARRDAFEVVRGDGRGRVQEVLALRDAALLVDGHILASAQGRLVAAARRGLDRAGGDADGLGLVVAEDRKSTRLNSSHSQISYAVFCLKKKKKDK